MKVYRIRADKNFKDYFEMRVYKTKKQMLSNIQHYSKKHDMLIEHDSRTAGLVQPTQIREFPALDDRKWFSSHFATLFLNEEVLPIEVIAHECLHIALAHERFVEHFVMDYGDDYLDDLTNEERLCYYHGRIFQGVFDILKKNKHLSRSLYERKTTFSPSPISKSKATAHFQGLA